MLKKIINSKIFMIFVLFLVFGGVAVVAENIFVSEEGIVSKYFASDGSAGMTRNFTATEGIVVVKDGLVVDIVNITTEIIGGIADWWDSSWSNRMKLSGLTGNISYIEIQKTLNDNSGFTDTRFVSCYDNDMVFDYVLESEVGSVGQFRINNQGENCTYRYYGNTESSSTSSTSDVYFNPIASYFFDGNANDFVGNNNGVVNSASLSNGKINGSYEFDGIDDYINLGVNVLDLTSDFTVNLWINADGVGDANQEIFDCMEVGAKGVRIQYKDISSGKIRVYANDATVFFEDSTVNPESWYFLTMKYEGINLSLSVNGEYKNSASVSINDCTIDYYIGRYNRGDLEHFNGKIDEVLIYNKALTQDQITKLYTQTAPSFTENEEESQ